MNKQADLVETFGKGVAVGAGVGTAIELARFVVQSIEDEKADYRRRHPHTDKNTIVFSIPPDESSEKKSSARDQFDVENSSGGLDIDIKNPERDTKGRFVPKWTNKSAGVGEAIISHPIASVMALLATLGINARLPQTQKKQQTWFDETADHTGTIVGGATGLALGYVLARKLAQKLEEKRINREIAAAQQEYIDVLQNKKLASYDILPKIPEVKSPAGIKTAQNDFDAPTQPPGSLAGSGGGDAADQVISLLGKAYKAIGPSTEGSRRNSYQQLEDLFPGLDKFMAKMTEGSTWFAGGTAATTIFTALAIAYVTKKMMDNKYGNPNDKKKSVVPRNTTVMFKTNSDKFEIDPGTAIVTFGFIKDAQVWNPEKDWWSKETNESRQSWDEGMAQLISDPSIFRSSLDTLSGKTTSDYNPLDVDSKNIFVSTPAQMRSAFNFLKEKDPKRYNAIIGRAILKNNDLVKILNDEYPDYVDSEAKKRVEGWFGENGFLKALNSGWLADTGVSKAIKTLAMWLFRNFRPARAAGIKSKLKEFGIENPGEILRKAYESEGGRLRLPTDHAPEIKKGSFGPVGSLGETLANININTDKRNDELDEKLDALLGNMKLKNKRTRRKYVSIKGDQGSKDFVKLNRKKILEILSELNAEQDDSEDD